MSIREVEDGEFQLTYENGDTYLGEHDRLLKYANGKGHYQSRDFEYLGFFKRNRMDGEGILKKNGRTYEGKFVKDDFVHGTCTYPNGAKYIGDFKNEKKHGYGEYTYKDYRYNGNWEFDMKHGSGIETMKKDFFKKHHLPVWLTWSKKNSCYAFLNKKFDCDMHFIDKRVSTYLCPSVNKDHPNVCPTTHRFRLYITEKKANEMSWSEAEEEFGTIALMNYTTAQLELIDGSDFPLEGEMTTEIIGNWEKNSLNKGLEKKSVNGELKYRYEGKFMKGKMHGDNGKVEWYNGDTYEGSFKNCKYDEGLYKNSNYSYNGKWVDENWKGIFKMPDIKINGQFPTGLAKVETEEWIYEGELKDGKKHGQGTMTFKAKGEIKNGLWINNKLSNDKLLQ